MATWTVTGDTPDQYSTVNGGTPQLGHVIQFTTGKGFQGSLFVTNAQYVPATVKAMLATKAATVDEINTLTSDSKV